MLEGKTDLLNIKDNNNDTKYVRHITSLFARRQCNCQDGDNKRISNSN